MSQHDDRSKRAPAFTGFVYSVHVPMKDERLLTEIRRLTAEPSDSQLFLKALRLYADSLGVKQ